jgi:uncharacterized protein YecE (DUF72 family)
VDTLFDLDGSDETFDRDLLGVRLRNLAARGVYIGGSSWKYEGWLGQIYSRSRYLVRGRLSKKLFEDTCLSEYSTVFPCVCGDFAFYQFPSQAFWTKLFRQTPDTFRWGFKVPEQITVPSWPVHPRYGALAGKENPSFLDLNLFEESFLRALEPHRRQVGVLIFEFGTFRAKDVANVGDFVKSLDPFLARLAAGWRYAVEIRNAEFLAPDYFECLRAHNIPHVYNAWARMPEIAEQFAIPESRTSRTGRKRTGSRGAAGTDRRGARGWAPGVHFREQPAGREHAGNGRGDYGLIAILRFPHNCAAFVGS